MKPVPVPRCVLRLAFETSSRTALRLAFETSSRTALRLAG